MIVRSKFILAVLLTIIAAVDLSCSPGSQSQTFASMDLESRSLEKALANGKPTLADFGSTTCIPCKNMKATLEELDPLYRDKANIAIIIVDDEANQELVAHYQIMTIPTQIFFSAAGKVVAGHVGEMGKADIIAQFKKMGIE
jgi:thioredoxin 1